MWHRRQTQNGVTKRVLGGFGKGENFLEVSRRLQPSMIKDERNKLTSLEPLTHLRPHITIHLVKWIIRAENDIFIKDAAALDLRIAPEKDCRQQKKETNNRSRMTNTPQTGIIGLHRSPPPLDLRCLLETR